MVKILVIGGTGFIGSRVVSILHTQGHALTVFHRGPTQGDIPEDVDHILCPESQRGDRRYFEKYRQDFHRLAPDLVLDMIPFVEQEAQALLSTFRGISPRIVAISSQDVYRAYGIIQRIETGDLEPTPLSEGAPLRTKLYPYRGSTPRDKHDPLHWLDNYDKILVEKTLMDHPDLPATILRLPMVYGPGDRQRRFYEYIQPMLKNHPSILLEEGLSGWHWTRGYVEDIARAIALGITHDQARGKIYNLGERETLSTYEWVMKIADVLGWKGEIEVVPNDSLPEESQTSINTDQHLIADTKRIRDELGFSETTSREVALVNTIEWLKDHPIRG